jgi:hypothetical protein
LTYVNEHQLEWRMRLPRCLPLSSFGDQMQRSRRQTAEFWRGAGYVVARPLIQVKEPGGWLSNQWRRGMVAGSAAHHCHPDRFPRHQMELDRRVL